MRAIEERLRNIIFAQEPEFFEQVPLYPQKIYRRQIRKTMRTSVLRALPITSRLLGEDTIKSWVDEWLVSAPLQTRLYWQIALEFSAWLQEKGDLPHPAVRELVHFETIEIDVLNAPNAPYGLQHVKLDEEVRAVLEPSVRLGIYQYPVHRMNSETETWPEKSSRPNFVFAFRRAEKFEWIGLAPQLAQLFAKMSEGATLGESMAFLNELYGKLNAKRLRTGLIDLHHRGLILAFQKD